MQLRRDNETDQERKSGPYYGMPSQKYENQNPYTNQNPYAYEDPYVVHTVPPVQRACKADDSDCYNPDYCGECDCGDYVYWYRKHIPACRN